MTFGSVGDAAGPDLVDPTGATILIVDDDPQNRKLLEVLLRPEGYVTRCVPNGERALAMTAKHPPDLIVLDVMMPGMDGFEVAARLKSSPLTATIPIIMLTANVDHTTRLAGLEAGAEEFLTKPVDRVELWLRVRNLLRLTRTQMALQLAREEADRANLAKSEFLSRMSHELRTPLNAVLGFAQLLQMDDMTADQRESVELISRAGKHLLQLINDVLDISRIEAGHLNLSLEPVHVGEVILSALELVRPQAAGRNVVVPAALGDDDGWVRADRQRLLQVMLNLLSNAVKYNRPGGTVELVVETVDDRVSIAVVDTGIGITGTDLARLFLPFERLGAEATAVEGSGVGLALSRVLAEQMGGTISVCSTVGVGSTFTLTLPIAVQPASDAGATGGEAEAIGVVAPNSLPARPMVVLAFEDNIANIHMLERALQRCENLELTTAIQGRLGLELAAQLHPDLILLDLHLPDLSGEEVLQLLRSDPATRGITVVVCSADASPGQRQRLLAGGAADYLTKPIDLADLFGIIERVRSEPPGGALIAAPETSP